VRACKRCSRKRRPTISHRRARVDSICARSVVSSEKVCSWLMDFGPSSAPISLSNSRRHPGRAICRPAPAPTCEAPIEEGFVQARQVPDLADAQRVQLLLRHFAHARNLAQSSGARKAGSCPGITHSTPLGLAWSEPILATRREAAIPMEQFRPGLRLHALVQQVAPRKGGPYRRSVPVMSR